MSEHDDAGARQRWILSALADGEAAAGEHDAVFRAWRDDEDCRATWHAYQVIGDVLRRDDLANTSRHDTAFLRAVRARLADEPVVLAPVAAPASDETLDEFARPAAAVAAGSGARAAFAAPSRTGGGRMGTWARAHWQGPAAMAAGFVIVAGGLMLRPGAVDNQMARGDVAGIAASQSVVPVVAGDQLKPYLDAHREWGGTASIQMPDVGLRSVSLTQPVR